MTGRILISLATVLLLAAAPSEKDLDNDGVRNRKDQCPDTPIGARVDETGCPIDSDGDTVPDGLDRCSTTPTGWPVDLHGCPRDGDEDKVVDAEDSCPATPPGARVDARGCPSDGDRDSILDGLDRCAGTPAGARVDRHGCTIDTDHDGVFDGLDQCNDSRPLEEVDSTGCRMKAPALFGFDSKTVVLEGVAFEPNEIELTPESSPALQKVAASLRDWPDHRVEVGTFTDSWGGSAKNLDLSQRRAQFVKEFLVTLGIDPERLVAKGYGEAKPIADNRTEEGRARNRRIELTKLEPAHVAGINQ